ncbi:anthranilate synthase component I family protein [Aureivirga sp. CE67]|uniref:anthranilate synthase component I family protein n=1 Tax=Aureivirga sp. CE67 TaxID=1788983 RepID=UPI0018C8ED1D|nr:anthranilate synthase component I family protein [Aureivirga sp. CE67]
MERIWLKKELSEVSEFKEKMLFWAQKFAHICWLDSNSHQAKYGSVDAVLAVDAERVLDCNYQNAFQKLTDFRNEVNDYIYGYLAYDLKNDVEKLTSSNLDGLHFSDLVFFQPKKIFSLQGNTLSIGYLNPQEIEKDLEEISNISLPKNQKISEKQIEVQQRISESEYKEKLEQVLYHIHRGDIYEANFCMEFFAENVDLNPFAAYQKLNSISTPPFATFFKTKNNYLASASPERFVKKKGGQIVSQPIKGTSKRGKNKEEDSKLIYELETNIKERAENIMIVDLVRNDLSRKAKKGTVEVTELCKIYTFEQVHQMISTIVCEVEEKEDVVGIIRDLFPMGSMTGAPKISAMQIMERLEESKRGLYSGAVGYFTPDGDFDFNVIIRSILYNAENKYASFSVGGAITAKSIIEKEYEECFVKANAMKKTLEEG